MAGFETLLALLLASTALAVLARRSKLPVPVVMVLGGVGVASLVPRGRLIEIEPDLAFGIFVPPLLFSGAISTSLRGLRTNARGILRLTDGFWTADAAAHPRHDLEKAMRTEFTSELLGKLTNLAYELFGVFLPGVVASFLLALWLMALGPCLPLWTGGTVPVLTMVGSRDAVDAAGVNDLVGLTVPALALWYFLGHTLLWISRSGRAESIRGTGAAHRIGRCLLLRVPKPSHPFDPSLEATYKLVQQRFAVAGATLEWRQFCPIVKGYLAERARYSLVPTYQNKYTLHRSLTIAAAGLFWLCVGSGAAAGMVRGASPHWIALAALTCGAVLLVWVFSASYLMHWGMFGNSIVTEAYGMLYAPKPRGEGGPDHGSDGEHREGFPKAYGEGSPS